MTRSINRRDLLKSAAALGTGLFLGTPNPRAFAAANEKINVGFIGIGGRGAANLGSMVRLGENVVALCDVDDARAGKAYQRYPKARKFKDFRRMYDAIAKQIDAVVISTPDHTHFHPAMAALQLGKHLYCEKPMAHSIWEVRQMTDLARKQKVATQLGVQRHTIPNVHRVVELIKAGAIGKVTEVHSWIGGTRGMSKIPEDRPEVPAHLDWDLWQGPVAPRPYHSTYCPYGWRFWWDYGTGETGNWGCHILDIPFWALDLDSPTHVSASGPPVHALTTPRSMATHMKFPTRGGRPAVMLNWYHANSGPEILKKHGLSAGGNNTLFIGSEGMLLCGFSKRKLLPESKFPGGRPAAEVDIKRIPASPGFYREWTAAIRGGGPATCHFDYSGPLTEAVLLGNVAYRSGGKEFAFDQKTLTITGNPRAAGLIKPAFRVGWQV